MHRETAIRRMPHEAISTISRACILSHCWQYLAQGIARKRRRGITPPQSSHIPYVPRFK
jgi:hypothetical protein